MKKYILLAIALASSGAVARPVSYAGGWTLMESHMNAMTSINVHYTTDKDNSIGYLA